MQMPATTAELLGSTIRLSEVVSVGALITDQKRNKVEVWVVFKNNDCDLAYCKGAESTDGFSHLVVSAIRNRDEFIWKWQNWMMYEHAQIKE